MTIGSDNLSNGSSTAQDRFSGGVSAYRQTRRETGPAGEHDDGDVLSRGGGPSLPTRTPSEPAKLSPLDLPGLTEPVFPTSGGWAAPSMADHPLLRGLLLELPVRGTMPDSGWLDRWFEAARSIIELLYAQEAKRK